MIEIRFLFGEWKAVTKEKAKDFVKGLMNSIVMMNEKEKIDYINKTKIRGITVEELLKEGRE